MIGFARYASAILGLCVAGTSGCESSVFQYDCRGRLLKSDGTPAAGVQVHVTTVVPPTQRAGTDSSPRDGRDQFQWAKSERSASELSIPVGWVSILPTLYCVRLTSGTGTATVRARSESTPHRRNAEVQQSVRHRGRTARRNDAPIGRTRARGRHLRLFRMQLARNEDPLTWFRALSCGPARVPTNSCNCAALLMTSWAEPGPPSAARSSRARPAGRGTS